MTVSRAGARTDSNMSEVVAVTPTGGPTRQESVTHIKRHKLANCNVPLVHGRPNPSISPRSRLTTHQRNQSLDFRYEYTDVVLRGDSESVSPMSPSYRPRYRTCPEKPLPECLRATLRRAQAICERDARLARVYVSWHLLNKRS